MELDRRSFLAGVAGLAVSPVRWQNLITPTVQVREGQLRGRREGQFHVFLGVPFAQPPVGKLRFRAPQTPEPWKGEREAVQNAPSAMQGDQGSEDCLYLNIWAPTTPGPHPVLVWIHGGGNVGGGTAGQSGVGFAREGIVVVTVAYRLGAFGYLDLEHLLGSDYANSGCNGIRDLEAALRWVRANIAAFGGDPESVTIAGQSAGAKNVAALVAAPSAQGLFHRAISFSGSGMTTHDPVEARRVTDLVQKALGGPAERLLTASGPELRSAQHRAEDQYDRAYPFRPCVGGSYLPEMPVHLDRGRVPFLLATCREESVAFLNDGDIGKPVRSREIANVPFSVIPEMESRYARHLGDLPELDRRVRLVTAEEYWIPSVRLAEAHAARGGKAWMYRFDHLDHAVQRPRDAFVAHGADMAFVWQHRDGWTLHEMVTQFIKGRLPEWPTYGSFHREVLVYGPGGKAEVMSDPWGEERRLWNGVI